MRITSTTYMDFLMRTGLSRLRVVKEARRQYDGEYSQGSDYYRRFKDGIVAMHRTGGSTDQLGEIVAAAPTKFGKHDNYAACLQGYEAWVRGKGIVWVSRPEPYLWSHGELTVRATPELRLKIDGEMYRVKLYFKSHKIIQAAANLVIHLHQAAGLADENIGVLDVRNGRLFTKTRVDAAYDTVLESEAASFIAMWHAIGASGQQAGEATS
jgi:hypothetical protein